MAAPHTLNDIREFLAHRRIAMPGISRNPKHFSRLLFADLRRRGYDVVPVNPAAAEIDGVRCAASMREIAPPVEGALVMTPAGQTRAVLEDCEAAGVRDVWLYRAFGPGAVSGEALEYAARRGMRVIGGECPFMFLPDTAWPHRAHNAWRAMTLRLPPESRA
ncbi:MAG: CoA-binding protein [Bryobacteraceae bacterium]